MTCEAESSAEFDASEFCALRDICVSCGEHSNILATRTREFDCLYRLCITVFIFDSNPKMAIFFAVTLFVVNNPRLPITLTLASDNSENAIDVLIHTRDTSTADLIRKRNNPIAANVKIPQNKRFFSSRFRVCSLTLLYMPLR